MMKTLLLGAFALAAVAAPATAATSFRTVLLGANETVPNNSPATGIGTLSLSADNRFAQIDISFTDLNVISLFSFALWIALMAWAASGTSSHPMIQRFVGSPQRRRRLVASVSALVLAGFATTAVSLNLA